MVTLSAAEILRRFIADEDQALSTGQRGWLWSNNESRIKPLLTKGVRSIEPIERRRVYFHALRLGCVPLVDAGEFDLLRAAHDDLLPTLGPITDISSLKLLWLFGRDGRGALPGDFAEDAAAYRRWLKVWQHLTAYTSIPGMLSKVARFQPYADDPLVRARSLAILRHTNYEPGFAILGSSRPFWGLVLVVLLAGGDERARMLDDIAHLPPRDAVRYLAQSTRELRETLDRCVAACAQA